MGGQELRGNAAGALSRRDLLRRAGVVGIAAAVPVSATASTAASAPEREARETFTAAEMDAVEAFVDSLIPSDASGPGAAEARVARYIDRALNGELAASRPAYRAGLAALDSWSRTRFGRAFADLRDGQQDAVLTDLEQQRRDRVHAGLAHVLRPRSRARAPGHVRRPVPRRERGLRRLGPDRVPGREARLRRRRSSSSTWSSSRRTSPRPTTRCSAAAGEGEAAMPTKPKRPTSS